MYADKITRSIQETLDETMRRREKQIRYNEEHGITPETVFKSRDEIMRQAGVLDIRPQNPEAFAIQAEPVMAAEPVMEFMNESQWQKAIQKVKEDMQQAAKDMDFLQAAKCRDEMIRLQKRYDEKFGTAK